MLKESTDSKIKGVIANFGKKDVDVEKQIDLLESEIIDTVTIEKEINELNNKIRTEIDKIHDTKKGKISIQKKHTSKSNDEVIALYNNDIEKAKKIENDENELLNIKGDDSLEKQKAVVILTNFKNEIDILSIQINRIIELKNSIIVNFGNDTTKYFDNVEANVHLLTDYKEKLNDKIKNINSQIDFEDEKLKNILSSIKNSYNNINKIKANELKILDEKISKLNILIKGAIGLEISNNTFINSNIQMVVK